jgi:hypothetical protein
MPVWTVISRWMRTVYTKLGRRRALARAQRAMDDYEQRNAGAETRRRLHVVKSA